VLLVVAAAASYIKITLLLQWCK